MLATLMKCSSCSNKVSLTCGMFVNTFRSNNLQSSTQKPLWSKVCPRNAIDTDQQLRIRSVAKLWFAAVCRLNANSFNSRTTLTLVLEHTEFINTRRATAAANPRQTCEFWVRITPSSACKVCSASQKSSWLATACEIQSFTPACSKLSAAGVVPRVRLIVCHSV